MYSTKPAHIHKDTTLGCGKCKFDVQTEQQCIILQPLQSTHCVYFNHINEEGKTLVNSLFASPFVFHAPLRLFQVFFGNYLRCIWGNSKACCIPLDMHWGKARVQNCLPPHKLASLPHIPKL